MLANQNDQTSIIEIINYYLSNDLPVDKRYIDTVMRFDDVEGYHNFNIIIDTQIARFYKYGHIKWRKSKKINPTVVYYIYRQAANIYGNKAVEKFAALELAKCFEEGYGVEVSKNKAAELYAKYKPTPKIEEKAKDNIDEYKQLCEEYESAISNNSIYRLTILPSLDCNLRCWYCFEKHIQGSHLENKTSDSIFRFVKKLFENNPNLETLDVELFGGEPLLYFEKELYPLLNKIKNYVNELGKNVSFFFVTNAVCINEATIPLFKELKANFQISIDGFKDRHDKIKFIPDTQIGTYNHVIQIIHRLFRFVIQIFQTEDEGGHLSVGPEFF